MVVISRDSIYATRHSVVVVVHVTLSAMHMLDMPVYFRAFRTVIVLYSITVVFLFPVESCVDLLKFQASKASCPLDLLVAESLASRLITMCNSSDQLFSKDQLVML